MAINSGQLTGLLVDGGMSVTAARQIANAIANGFTPNRTSAQDTVDTTPRTAMRLIDGDSRKYLFGNLDYADEKPYRDALAANPGQYVSDLKDHPYKDSQPAAQISSLQTPTVAGGNYVDVTQATQENTSVNTVSLRVQNLGGTHLRINQATNTVEAVPLVFKSPQGIVTASVAEGADSTTVNLLGGELFSRPAFVCRAWAYFSGTRNTLGNVDPALTNRLIRGSGNVSSILKAGTGLYSVVFQTPMLTNNYTVLVTTTFDTLPIYVGRTGSGNVTTQCSVVVNNITDSVPRDGDFVHVAVFE
jgi:hypothetical protein